MSNLLKVGITHGNINGIGGELILRFLSATEVLEICTPVVFSTITVMNEQCKALGLEPIAFNVVGNSRDIIDGKINLINVCSEELHTQWGEKNNTADKAEISALKMAIEAYNKNDIDLLVTAPGNLRNDLTANAATTFIQQHLENEATVPYNSLQGNGIRLIALPIQKKQEGDAETFNAETFIGDLRNIHQALRNDMTELRPRIAIVTPAVSDTPKTEEGAAQAPDTDLRATLNELHKEGILAFGPYESGRFLNEELYKHYDAIVTWGNKKQLQTLTDLIDPDKAVGYTMGLPIVHTYPTDGISYQTAGKGTASATALRNAVYLGIDICRNRHLYKKATRRPLEKQWIPRGRDDFKLDLTKEDTSN